MGSKRTHFQSEYHSGTNVENRSNFYSYSVSVLMFAFIDFVANPCVKMQTLVTDVGYADRSSCSRRLDQLVCGVFHRTFLRYHVAPNGLFLYQYGAFV